MSVGSRFFQSKVFKSVVMIVNVALIIGLVSYIVYIHTVGTIMSKQSSEAPIVYANGYTDEELELAMEQAGENMIGIYGKLIPGSRAEFSDGNVMTFSNDGVFNGYFDQDNTAITGTYVIIASDDEYLANLNIYNVNSSQYVQYKLMYDENKDFMLYYPADKAYITLNY